MSHSIPTLFQFNTVFPLSAVENKQVEAYSSG
jgi:hypothetical protein